MILFSKPSSPPPPSPQNAIKTRDEVAKLEAASKDQSSAAELQLAVARERSVATERDHLTQEFEKCAAELAALRETSAEREAFTRDLKNKFVQLNADHGGFFLTPPLTLLINEMCNDSFRISFYFFRSHMTEYFIHF